MTNRINSFFLREDINTGRQANIDFAKCMAIIFMVTVHCFMYPEYRDLTSGFPYIVYGILGGFLAAPVFMISMGIGFTFTKKGDPLTIIKRGIKIFIDGYIVNILRSIGPIIWSIAHNGFSGSMDKIIFGCLIGDILQFAGLAMITYGLLKKLKIKPIFMFAGSFIIAFTFSFLPLINLDSPIASLLLGLIVPAFTEGVMLSCFPLTTWFVFVAFGVLFGQVIRKVKHLDRFYIWTLLVGAILFTSFFVLDHLTEMSINKVGFDNVEYYNYFSLMFYSIGSTLVVYSLFHFLSKLTSEKFKKLAFKMADSVNEIYIISWILIFNVFDLLFGYVFPGDYDMWVYLVASFVILVISVVAAYYYRKLKKTKNLKFLI